MDKKELFLPIYGYSYGLLQNVDPELYEAVMNSLVFPQNWRILIHENQHLASFYARGVYGAWRREHPGALILRFMRNSYSHSTDHAMDMAAMQQMYNQAQLGEMLETDLPLLLHTLQVALDRQGLLREIELWTLFL